MSEKHNNSKYQTSQPQQAYPSSGAKSTQPAQPYYPAHYQQQMQQPLYQQHPKYQQQMPQYPQQYPQYQQQMPPYPQQYPQYQQQMPPYPQQYPQYQQQMPQFQQQYPQYQQMPQFQQQYPQQQIPMYPQQQNQDNQMPIEQSYIENILRMNYGKTATVYMTFENNEEWNAKVFRGRIEAAGRDHIILSEPDTGKRYLLLMVYLDYVTFTEELNYQYPYGSRSQNTQSSASET